MFILMSIYIDNKYVSVHLFSLELWYSIIKIDISDWSKLLIFPNLPLI